MQGFEVSFIEMMKDHLHQSMIKYAQQAFEQSKNLDELNLYFK